MCTTNAENGKKRTMKIIFAYILFLLILNARSFQRRNGATLVSFVYIIELCIAYSK